MGKFKLEKSIHISKDCNLVAATDVSDEQKRTHAGAHMARGMRGVDEVAAAEEAAQPLTEEEEEDCGSALSAGSKE